MLNAGERWPAQPNWPDSVLAWPGLKIRSVDGLHQQLVGGSLEAWSRASGLDATGTGAFAIAEGDPYCLRLSRDQLLIVGTALPTLRGRSHEEEYAVTEMSAGYHVFEMSGGLALEILARATTLDPHGASSSAALLFAGVNAVVYRYPDGDTWRIHVDRSLATHLWSWFASVAPLVDAGA